MSGHADPMVPDVATVLRTTHETADTVTLELMPPDGRPFAFRPGQFNMLYAFGAGESAISIAGSAGEPDRLVHTIRDVGTVTHRLTAAKHGAMIGVRGPYGRPWPVETAHGRDLLIVAGGIGLAPLRPVILDVLAHRERYGRVAVLYGARTPADLLYGRELSRWRGRLDLHVEVTVDRADAGWRGEVGVVTRLIRLASFDPATAVAMVCGPEIMMKFAAQELVGAGVAGERVHVSMERNMKCAIGFCGHCQLGKKFVCKDGPVFAWPDIRRAFEIPEL